LTQLSHESSTSNDLPIKSVYLCVLLNVSQDGSSLVCKQSKVTEEKQLTIITTDMQINLLTCSHTLELQPDGIRVVVDMCLTVTVSTALSYDDLV